MGMAEHMLIWSLLVSLGRSAGWRAREIGNVVDEAEQVK
jgi:hypothetical protein